MQFLAKEKKTFIFQRETKNKKQKNFILSFFDKKFFHCWETSKSKSKDENNSRERKSHKSLFQEKSFVDDNLATSFCVTFLSDLESGLVTTVQRMDH